MITRIFYIIFKLSRTYDLMIYFYFCFCPPYNFFYYLNRIYFYEHDFTNRFIKMIFCHNHDFGILGCWMEALSAYETILHSGLAESSRERGGKYRTKRIGNIEKNRGGRDRGDKCGRTNDSSEFDLLKGIEPQVSLRVYGSSGSKIPSIGDVRTKTRPYCATSFGTQNDEEERSRERNILITAKEGQSNTILLSVNVSHSVSLSISLTLSLSIYIYMYTYSLFFSFFFSPLPSLSLSLSFFISPPSFLSLNSILSYFIILNCIVIRYGEALLNVL